MNKINNLHVIVPHRGVNAGKSRLSAVLNDVARGRLNRWLLARTLDTVTAWLGDTQRCVVVSPCEVTLALARKAGAVALQEQAATSGLNTALSQAAAHAAARGAQRLLILPCDLPRLDTAALDAMQAAVVSGNEAVIAPDRHRDGTNALLVDAGVREFAFGKGSYTRHLALGDAYGARTVPCVHAALAFDLDTADDFAEWAKCGDVPQEFLATLPHPAPRGVGFVSSRTK
jgi:2-phospho-L-lactate/phosphoenolpyruvate guanylyltransferase